MSVKKKENSNGTITMSIREIILTAVGIFLIAITVVLFLKARLFLWSFSWRWQPIWKSFILSPLSISRFFRRTLVHSVILTRRRSRVIKNPPGNGVSSALCDCSQTQETPELNEEHLKELISYIDETDGGPSWILMTEKSIPTLSFQAWYRDSQSGLVQYRTRALFQNVSPELLRDFFWDDEYRKKWDGTLIYARILAARPQAGTMLVHWIRKLPFFYGNREYVIIRRIWEYGSSYYCVTKGTSNPSSLPRNRTRRRVDLYYSSWHIREVRGHPVDSEVLLFHYEDPGIPAGVMKIGIKAGMWRAAKKLDAGLQAYLAERRNGLRHNCYADMAARTTKISPSTVIPNHLEVKADNIYGYKRLHPGKKTIKWLIMGGILIACGMKLGDTLRKRFKFGATYRTTTRGKQDAAGQEEGGCNNRSRFIEK